MFSLLLSNIRSLTFEKSYKIPMFSFPSKFFLLIASRHLSWPRNHVLLMKSAMCPCFCLAMSTLMVRLWYLTALASLMGPPPPASIITTGNQRHDKEAWQWPCKIRHPNSTFLRDVYRTPLLPSFIVSSMFARTLWHSLKYPTSRARSLCIGVWHAILRCLVICSSWQDYQVCFLLVSLSFCLSNPDLLFSL